MTTISEPSHRCQAIHTMVTAIQQILEAQRPTIYLYGSCVLDDFSLGWSDIDLLVLTQAPIPEAQAQSLVPLRQHLLERDPTNPYYRAFEGGMLTLSAFLTKAPDRVVYWGTSGQRLTNTYHFDSFCMAELLQRGERLCGEELRAHLTMPTYADFHRDVKKHCETIRLYAQKTDSSLYSFGWLLDIARGLYTLHTGEIASKTAAGQWALENGLCPVPEALEAALRVRKNPRLLQENPALSHYATTLGPEIQRFADVLEKALEQHRSAPSQA